MAKIGWLVTGGLTLMTGIVLMYVLNTHDTRASSGWTQWEEKLDRFLTDIQRVDPTNEDSIRLTIEKINGDTFWRGTRIQEAVTTQLSKLNVALQRLIKTGKAKAPDDSTAKEVIKRYIDAWRTVAKAATSATTGEDLAPYGALEDAICTELQKSIVNKDAEAEAIYQPMREQIYVEVNGIVVKLFDEAYQNHVPWTNLLADTAGWTIVPSTSFKHTFGACLTLVNERGKQPASGGLSYTPADRWRDYVLEVEVKVDSGAMTFYTRIGDKMDPKEVPGFTLGTRGATIQIAYGKTYNLVISTIGNQLTVTGDGIFPYSETIESVKSRKGEPGIAPQPGTTATITKLRARHLR